MPSTYTSNNGIEKPATGEENNTWGVTANTDFDLIDQALDGFVSLSLTGTTSTLAITDGAVSDGRNRIILCTGTLAANHTITVTPNDAEKYFFVYNNTTGGFSVIIAQGGGSGSTVTIAAGYWSLVRLDGTGSNANVTRLLDSFEVTTAVKASTYTAAGAMVLKPGSNSTSAFTFQNASGTQQVVIDSTNTRMSVGTTAGASRLGVISNSTVASVPTETAIHVMGSNDFYNNAILLDGVGNSGTVIGRFTGNTAASPAPPTGGEYLAAFEGRAYLSAAYSNALGRIAIAAESAFTGSSARTGIRFEVTNTSSVTLSEKMRLNGAGQLLLGTTSATGGASVAMEISSTSGGFLLPRMTTAQRDALTVANGMMIYNTTTGKIQGYQSGAWADMA